MRNLFLLKLPLILIIAFSGGCASTPTPVTHVWKEIRGLGVPYEGIGDGAAVLLSDLSSNGCVWLPAGTVVFGDKPWPRSPYSPIFSYRLPKTSTVWPCTAEAVDRGLIYFSHVVVPTQRINCAGASARIAEGDGKSTVRMR